MNANEKLKLSEILKECPWGTWLYSPLFGDVQFCSCGFGEVVVSTAWGQESFHDDGRYYAQLGECLLFPSKDQREWSKFVACKKNEVTNKACDLYKEE